MAGVDSGIDYNFMAEGHTWLTAKNVPKPRMEVAVIRAKYWDGPGAKFSEACSMLNASGGGW
jgi:hypothetical protein